MADTPAPALAPHGPPAPRQLVARALVGLVLAAAVGALLIVCVTDQAVTLLAGTVLVLAAASAALVASHAVWSAR